MIIKSTNNLFILAEQNSLNVKRPRHIPLEIQVLPWDRETEYGGAKPTIENIRTLPHYNWIYNGNSYIY